MRPRPLSAGVAAVAGTPALSACQQPTPLVTVPASGASTHVEGSGGCVEGENDGVAQWFFRLQVRP